MEDRKTTRKMIQWKDIAELVGIAAIVGSLLFVGLQMRQTHAIATAEMNAAALANSIEVSNAIIDHAEVWVRGNSGEELTPDDQAIYSQLVRNVNNAVFFSVQQQRELRLDRAAELDIATYAGFLHENPGAREVWRTREADLQRYRALVDPNEQLTSEWIQSIESVLAILDAQAERE